MVSSCVWKCSDFFYCISLQTKLLKKKNKRAFLKVVKLPRFLISPHVPSSEFLLSISSCSWRFPGRACNCSLPAADHTFQTKMNGALSSSYLFPHLVGVASRVPVISLLRYNPFPLSDSTSLSRGSLDPIICATCLWDVLGSCCLDILFHCSWAWTFLKTLLNFVTQIADGKEWDMKLLWYHHPALGQLHYLKQLFGDFNFWQMDGIQ